MTKLKSAPTKQPTTWTKKVQRAEMCKFWPKRRSLANTWPICSELYEKHVKYISGRKVSYGTLIGVELLTRQRPSWKHIPCEHLTNRLDVELKARDSILGTEKKHEEGCDNVCNDESPPSDREISHGVSIGIELLTGEYYASHKDILARRQS